MAALGLIASLSSQSAAALNTAINASWPRLRSPNANAVWIDHPAQVSRHEVGNETL